MFCIIWLATSCKKEQTTVAKLNYQSGLDSLVTLKTNKDLTLNPEITGKAASYQWTENGQVVANTPSYTFKKAEPGNYELTFTVENDGGKASLRYYIKVIGTYGDGVLLLSYTDKTGFGNAEISHITEDGVLSIDVFSKENPGKTLSASANNLYYFNNQYYITSADGPNNLSVIDAQSLKLNYVVKQSGISNVTYFATADGKTGYVNISTRRKTGLYSVDLTSKTIATSIVTGSQDVTLLPISKINQAIVTPAGKQLIKVEDGKLTVLNTYKENVAGVVKGADANYWVGVQGSAANKAKFIRLDQNNKGVDSVELSADFKLPANGILTSSGTSEYFYWQETSTGTFCRFNTKSRTAEKYVNPMDAGIIFATCWKVNPKNGDLYIADSPEIFSGGEPFSHVYIFDQAGKLKKEVKKAGNQITDIVFPR